MPCASFGTIQELLQPRLLTVLAHESHKGAIAGAGVQHAVEWQPRDHIHTKAAAPARLLGVAAGQPRLVIDFLRQTHHILN